MAEATRPVTATRIARAVVASCGTIAQYNVQRGASRSFFVQSAEALFLSVHANKVASTNHLPFETPLARAQIYSLWRCRDGSFGAVFNGAMEVARNADEIIRTEDNRFAGVWDGERVEVLYDAINAAAIREGHDSRFAAAFARTLTIPLNSLQKGVAGDRAKIERDVGPVLAVDKQGGMLCMTPEGTLQPVTVDYLRRKRQMLSVHLNRPGNTEVSSAAVHRDIEQADRLLALIGGPRSAPTSMGMSLG